MVTEKIRSGRSARGLGKFDASDPMVGLIVDVGGKFGCREVVGRGTKYGGVYYMRIFRDGRKGSKLYSTISSWKRWSRGAKSVSL